MLPGSNKPNVACQGHRAMLQYQKRKGARLNERRNTFYAAQPESTL